jgi:hypothetical protein
MAPRSRTTSGMTSDVRYGAMITGSVLDVDGGQTAK